MYISTKSRVVSAEEGQSIYRELQAACNEDRVTGVGCDCVPSKISSVHFPDAALAERPKVREDHTKGASMTSYSQCWATWVCCPKFLCRCRSTMWRTHDQY